MHTYAERVELADDPVWIKRCRQAALAHAMEVGNDPGATAGELALLEAVHTEPDRHAQLFSWALATHDLFAEGSFEDPLHDDPEGDTSLQSLMATVVWPAFTPTP